jgi:formamidase
LDEAEMSKALHLAATWGLSKIEESAPISVVGSGPNLNSATEVGLRRAAQLLSMTVPEVMNRATITGGIEIGRHPGVVQITFRAPLSALETAGLLPFVQEQYGIG